MWPSKCLERGSLQWNRRSKCLERGSLQWNRCSESYKPLTLLNTLGDSGVIKKFCSKENVYKISVKDCILIKLVQPLNGWGVNLTLRCGFSKTLPSRDRLKPWFFVTFNIAISLIFPENVFEISQVFQKIWRFSPSILTIFIIFFGFLDISLL